MNIKNNRFLPFIIIVILLVLLGIMNIITSKTDKARSVAMSQLTGFLSEKINQKNHFPIV